MVYCIKETAVIGLGSKITLNGDCSHAIKGCLLLGRKVMTNPDSTLKNRDITLWTKVHIVKPMVFPVVMSGCESRTIKEAERWRIDSFELQCLRRVLRVPWTIRRSNQSFLKEINSEYSLEGLLLKLKLQYFGCLMWRVNSLVKDPDAGKDGRHEEMEVTEDEMVGWHYWFKGHELGQTLGDGEGQGSLACYSPWGPKELDTTWWLNNNKYSIKRMGSILSVCYWWTFGEFPLFNE